MEKIIQIVVVLFILSMIFERINEFLKNYLSCKKVPRLGWYIVGDTTTKYPTGSKEEKRREYRILKMNLFLGFLTSFLAHASFFDLLRNLDNPGKVIGWPSDFSLIFKDITFGAPFQFVIGCLFTGAFISMGSKFWHDLLDLLLEAKNYKKKINEIKDVEIDTISDLDAFIISNDTARFDAFLTDYFEKLGISHFVSHYESKTVDVYPLQDSQINTIPKAIPFKALTGKVEVFKVMVRENPEFETQQGPIFPASKISNAGNDIQINFGSLGLFVWNFTKTVRHFLTCYHVVWKNHNWEFFQPNGLDQVIDLSNNRSTILKAFRNTEIDVALLEPPAGVQLDQQLPPFIEQNTVLTSRPVGDNDKLNKSIVRMNGVKSGVRTGRIIDIKSEVKGIKYPDNSTWNLKNVIVVESVDNKPFSVGGDSGSIVFDEQNIVIGMLVAGSTKTKQSVIIPISSIENQLLIKI